MNNDVVIIVPIYKKMLDWHEVNSLDQLFSICGKKYNIIAIYPESIDISYYENNFDFYRYDKFWDIHFTSKKNYSNLMLNKDFYMNYTDYKYMFLYQLDGWIFKDKLEEWCDKGYDYIGAPLMSEYNMLNTAYMNYNGNGGVSLRNIQWMIDNLERINVELLDLNFEPYEDMFISTKFIFNNHPSFLECAKFSWDSKPDLLYKLIDFNLPFCCHAYLANGYNFYKDFNFITYYKE